MIGGKGLDEQARSDKLENNEPPRRRLSNMACPHPIILRPLALYGAIRLLDSSIYRVLLTIRISAKTERGPPRMSDFSALLNKYRVKVFLSHSASDLRERANGHLWLITRSS